MSRVYERGVYRELQRQNMGFGGIGNGVETLNKKELITRAKALQPDERIIVAKCIDTDTLQVTLKRRDEFTSDILKAIQKELEGLSNPPTIQEKEAAIREIRAILRIPDIR